MMQDSMVTSMGLFHRAAAAVPLNWLDPDLSAMRLRDRILMGLVWPLEELTGGWCGPLRLDTDDDTLTLLAEGEELLSEGSASIEPAITLLLAEVRDLLADLRLQERQ